MILSEKRITKALIRLRGCAGWSAPVLFANPRRQVFSRRGPFDLQHLSLMSWGKVFNSCLCYYMVVKPSAPSALVTCSVFVEMTEPSSGPMDSQHQTRWWGPRTEALYAKLGIYSKTCLKKVHSKKKTCLKGPLKNRQNKGINDKW